MQEGAVPPPLQDTLAVMSNIRSLGHLNTSGASRSGLRTDIDMVCAGLSVGEALPVLRGIFLLPRHLVNAQCWTWPWERQAAFM